MSPFAYAVRHFGLRGALYIYTGLFGKKEWKQP
jgi:hypothetical protein